MTGSLSTAALLTGTAAGVVALVALGLAGAARWAGLALSISTGRASHSPRSPLGR
ncbi:MAG: hypothetical protein WBX00_34635 [Isosphaeraceae bacterium]